MTAPAPLLDLETFRLNTCMPSGDVDAVEADTPGYIAARCEKRTSGIYARLRKRYAVPFTPPFPDAVVDWMVAIITWDAYMKRGADPGDPSIAHVKEDRDRAITEIKEAADSEKSLFDLPTTNDEKSSALEAPAPLSYSEQSPWTWTDIQACEGRREDGRR